MKRREFLKLFPAGGLATVPSLRAEPRPAVQVSAGSLPLRVGAPNGLRPAFAQAFSLGHPDRLADFVADGVVDEVLRMDPESEGACSVWLDDGLVIGSGQFIGVYPDWIHDLFSGIARGALLTAGYDGEMLETPPAEFLLRAGIRQMGAGISRGLLGPELAAGSVVATAHATD
jgi:hypothetical protein